MLSFHSLPPHGFPKAKSLRPCSVRAAVGSRRNDTGIKGLREIGRAQAPLWSPSRSCGLDRPMRCEALRPRVIPSRVVFLKQTARSLAYAIPTMSPRYCCAHNVVNTPCQRHCQGEQTNRFGFPGDSAMKLGLLGISATLRPIPHAGTSGKTGA